MPLSARPPKHALSCAAGLACALMAQSASAQPYCAVAASAPFVTAPVAAIASTPGPMAAGAPVPAYWIGDAAAFVQSARALAAVMQREGSVRIPRLLVFGQQTGFVAAFTRRALDDLVGLLDNANAVYPRAVPEVREAIAELVAAEAQLLDVAVAVDAGHLGPTYHVTLGAAARHLARAEWRLGGVARSYGAFSFTLPPGSSAVSHGPSAAPSVAQGIAEASPAGGASHPCPK